MFNRCGLTVFVHPQTGHGSNARIRLFSPKLNTAALCGGSRYSPTTLRNFSSTCLVRAQL